MVQSPSKADKKYLLKRTFFDWMNNEWACLDPDQLETTHYVLRHEYRQGNKVWIVRFWKGSREGMLA